MYPALPLAQTHLWFRLHLSM